MQSQVKRRIVFGLTTGGLLASGGAGFAHADASASGTASGDGTTTAGSPGILSGNTIQIPLDVPINVCGVTANVGGLFNPAAGNSCANGGGASAGGLGGGQAAGGASASGSSSHSPGILSGNTIQAPVNVPVNVCGDTVNVVGVGNGAKGNHCENSGGAAAGGSTGGASATGSSTHSPGILSGNTIQAPVNVPVNVCGDTVNVVGVHNDAKGNHCENAGGSGTGATATGSSSHSPGILSGNTIQLPVSVPVNVCGDSVNVVGVGNEAAGNGCANGTPSVPVTPPSTNPPPPTTSTPGGVLPHAGNPEGGGYVIPASATGTLAHTGADGLMLAPLGAALMGGGAFMYRRFNPSRAKRAH